MIQQRHGTLVPRLILNLSCPGQRRNIIWRDLQRLPERRQSLLAVAFTGQRDALEGPQLGIVWRCLQGGTTQFDSFVEFLGAQRRTNRLDRVIVGPRKTQSWASQQDDSKSKLPKRNH